MDADIRNQQLLNPFVFPAETNLRFTLLLVAALTSAFSVGTFFGFDFGVYTNFPVPQVKEHSAQSLPADLRSFGNVLTYLAMPIGLMLAVVSLAIIIYCTHPSRLRHRKNLQAITRDQDPSFLEDIANLTNLVGVSPTPTIEIESRSISIGGQAFGFRNRPALLVGGRMRLLRYKAPERFRAIILHELAHIANQDVQRSYFTQALWVAVVAVVMTPLLTYAAFFFIRAFIDKLSGGITSAEWVGLLTLTLPSVVLQVLQVSVILALVRVIRANLLRTREIYADWRAALWGAKAPLVDFLQQYASKDKVRRWGRLQQLHPSVQERLITLQDPTRLFQITSDIPFFVGFLFAYVLANGIVLALGLSISLSVIIMLILIFGVAYMVTLTLGLQVQRQAVAEMITGEQGFTAYLRLGVPAALFALGSEVGFVVSPMNAFAPLLLVIRDLGRLVGIPLLLLWIIGATCLMWMWMCYVRIFAKRILGAHMNTAPPHKSRRLLTLASSVLLTVLYVPALVGHLIIGAIIAGISMGSLPLLGIVVFFLLVVALFLYAVVFGGTWALAEVLRFLTRSHCPSCKQVSHQQYAIGHTCEHCGRNLAVWLFTYPRSTKQIYELVSDTSHLKL